MRQPEPRLSPLLHVTEIELILDAMVEKVSDHDGSAVHIVFHEPPRFTFIPFVLALTPRRGSSTREGLSSSSKNDRPHEAYVPSR